MPTSSSWQEKKLRRKAENLSTEMYCKNVDMVMYYRRPSD